jgi:DNA-binding CsgD family transcriptional regulator
MPAHAVDVRDPGVVELLLDVRAMSLWELLRRTGRPCELADLANWAQCPASVVQLAMDQLARFGLVESVRAGGRHRAVAYRVTRERIVLAGSPRDPTDRALLKRFYEDCQEANDRVFGSGAAFERSWKPGELFEFLCAPISLNDLEAREFRRRLDDLLQFVKLVRSKHNGLRTLPPPRCNHYLTIRVQPLAKPVLAQPDLTVAPRGQVPPPEFPEPEKGWQSLSAREREVAIALVGGFTLPEIARHLGRSRHTIGTLTRRIYRKLGIRRRAQLVHRLRIVDGPPVS